MIDTVPNTFPDLFAGYTVVWVLLVGYMLCLGYRVRRLEKRGRNQNESQNPDSNVH